MQFTILYGDFHIKTQKLNPYYSSGLREIDSFLYCFLRVNVYVGVVPLAIGKLKFSQVLIPIVEVSFARCFLYVTSASFLMTPISLTCMLMVLVYTFSSL